MSVCGEKHETEQRRAWRQVNNEDAMTSAETVRVWLVDDDDELRQLLGEALNQQNGVSCMGQFSSAEAALDALTSKTAPEVILLDINIGNQNGLKAIQPLRAAAPGTQILMLTTFYDSLKETEALRSGASGFLLKSFELGEIADAIRQAHARVGGGPVPVHVPEDVSMNFDEPSPMRENCSTSLGPASGFGVFRSLLGFARITKATKPAT